MSRVLARPMFKKKAPKRSSKGVGITSGLMDDVAGYAEGGEVTDDRTERERVARSLLERNRDENSEYQTFSERERPQMYRPAATMPMPPQPNPQQVQAMQMQQMAQMGMLPRFQEGGEVTPSAWSRLRQGIGSAIGLRGRSGQPMFARGTEPEIYGSPVGSNMGSPAMDNPEFRNNDNFFARMYRDRSPMPEGMPTPVIDARVNEFGLGVNMGDYPLPEGGGRNLFGQNPLGAIGGAIKEGAGAAGAILNPQFAAPEAPPPRVNPRRSEAAEEERLRRSEEKKAPPPPPPPRDRTGGGGGADTDKTDLSAIKAEREAKAAAARQENVWLALMQAGLAIAGGRSPNAITNIGQGGQAGLASFMALEQQRRRDEDAAMRRDLGEREFRLQERRLNMQEPYYAAMTQAQQMRPILQAQNQQRMLMVAQQNAAREAERLWQNKLKSDTQLQMMNPTQRKIEEDIYIRETTKKLFQPEWARVSLGVSQSQRDSYNTPEE